MAGNLNMIFGCSAKVAVCYYSYGVHGVPLGSIGMNIILLLLQSISVALLLGQSAPEFIGSVEVKLLVWKVIKRISLILDFLYWQVACSSCRSEK